MGIITSEERYIEAVKELFPRGKFFESELQNSESDLLKVVKIKGQEIYSFKQKMKELLNESNLLNCSEKTIADYERIYGLENRNDLTLEQRKAIIKNKETATLNIDFIKTTAGYLGGSIREIKYPYLPVRFGESRFGKTRIYDLKVFNVVYIYARIVDEDKKETFEKETKNMILSSQFGKARFGVNRLFNIRVFNFEYVHSQIVDRQKKEKFEKAIINIMLANQIIYFKYKGELQLCLCIQQIES